MRWLCIDPGTKRTGVALSSPEGTFAVPLRVLQHGIAGLNASELAVLMREYGAEGLVVGLPLSMDGTATTQTVLAVQLARRIAVHLNAGLETPAGVALPESVDATLPAEVRGPSGEASGIRIILWDERLSSWEAQKATAESGAAGRKRAGSRRALLDAHAAAVILQSFLDAQSAMPQDERESGDFGHSGPAD